MFHCAAQASWCGPTSWRQWWRWSSTRLTKALNITFMLGRSCAVILVWANIAAATMAMMIGAATPSDAAANTAGSLAIMASLLFGGFMLNKDQVLRFFCSLR